jgi:hypothetical protein
METTENTPQTGQIDLSPLSEPIEPRWRIQSVNGKKAICVPYLDARAVHERLDLVVGRGNWQNTYDADSGVASIGILIDGEWRWKSDVGTVSKQDPIKGKASDAFKRAAVLWGIGRDLYTTGSTTLDSDGNKYAKTAKGQVLYTGEQLTNYINGINESTALLMQIVKQNSHLNEQVEYQNYVKGLLEILKTQGV